ncbi:DUF1127 domain-containing protein [Halomonas sp. McH1-25]|uniref:DUF1127 domain-containing protein n=1 Tax=unclassified Halomonas TaxID=2609666 RepID=UPI001EF46D1B|nr:MULTISPECIES: DUF1127 domain-containing protein [unclassified Halomonas]MCG7600274.1 DUF1127 domain-containing protein [Halomonas sp. McH1-25]MCP1343410.1 DUF1127 domain-containing protein [Halomonas sp. FL8]MCP1359613.1 DUF1127 domain-containing protein [Halomonas sp. BBD45]
MHVTNWLARICKALTVARRDRNNFRALAHLDDHLLKDIGLYVDQGIVRPLHPDAAKGDVELAAPLDFEEIVGRADIPVKVCPTCGAALA